MSTGTGSDRDIDRPLGLSDRRRSRRFQMPGAGNIAAGILVIAVAGAASAIALREQPFRDPPPVAVSAPEMANRRRQANKPCPASADLMALPSFVSRRPR